MCDNLSADIANNWYYELQDEISSLQTFPKRCPIAPEASIVERKQYRVLFVVEEEVIAIIHVRHSHQSYVGETFE